MIMLNIVTLCLMVGRVFSQDAVNCAYTNPTAIEYKPNYNSGYTSDSVNMIFDGTPTASVICPAITNPSGCSLWSAG